jgi:hypothetical protein
LTLRIKTIRRERTNDIGQLKQGGRAAIFEN